MLITVNTGGDPAFSLPARMSARNPAAHLLQPCAV